MNNSSLPFSRVVQHERFPSTPPPSTPPPSTPPPQPQHQQFIDANEENSPFVSSMNVDFQEENPEYRNDPWNHNLYTKEEFFEYYGRYLEWDFQHPEKILKRKKINDMIYRYRNTLKKENINHLIDMLIETFM
tara:strand:- start:360 stop:758 length:399 start_codon:yes stop_codon:yes gene_type:complete